MSKAQDKKGQAWKPHEVAVVKSGKFAGLYGTVTGADEDTGQVRVLIDGMKNGQAITVEEWFKAGNIQRAKQ